jgi:predicted DNA-binding ribbon-helix-helix protein
MRTTVMIEDDVYATAKQIAENSGRSLGEVISQLARKGLASEPSFDIKNGVPVFRVGDALEWIPGDRAAEILAEED